MNGQALLVYIALVAGTLALGFAAWRWRGEDGDDLVVWGLGSRRYGATLIWLLAGAAIYTAYTYIAVPSLVASSGAIGFFAIPYAIMTTSLIAIVAPRFYALCRQRGYLTAGDFVRGEHGSRTLALAIALTGILATLPYIALQMYGVEVSLAQLGIHPQVALICAFLLLSVIILLNGLHAATLTAVVKDALVAVVVVVAFIALPAKFGGWPGVFAAAGARYAAAHHTALPVTLAPGQGITFATLALGSALALFLYPHVQTAMLAARDATAVRRGTQWLPLFVVLLAMLALLGYVALAAGTRPAQFAPVYDANGVVPALFAQQLPPWLAGAALAAISIGGLVPAAIMAIAVGLLVTRNVAPLLRQRPQTAYEATTLAKVTTLIVNVGALALLLFVEQSGVVQSVINFQLIGGIWILQTLPAVLLRLYTAWFHRRALLAGWLAGMALGTWMTLAQPKISTSYPLLVGGQTFVLYVGVVALAVNLGIAAALTFAFRLARRVVAVPVAARQGA